MGVWQSDNRRHSSKIDADEVPASPSQRCPTTPPLTGISVPSVSPISEQSSTSKKSWLYAHSRNSHVLVKSCFDQIRLSRKIINIAANFWNSKVNSLPFADQMEVGVTLFLDMLVKDKSLKMLMKRNPGAIERLTIEMLALKFLNAMGWLIRIMCSENENMEATLKTMGAVHKAMGIRPEHFTVMIKSFHETLAHYFTHDYGIKERYAVDYMFTLASQIMMSEPMTSQYHIIDMAEPLESLKKCLRSEVGREYLFRYLQQTWCDEIAIYLQSVQRFEQQTTNKGRFMIARNIVDVSINAHSDMAVNISYECRMNVLCSVHQYEEQFRLKMDLADCVNLFDKVTQEIHKLVRTNHWEKFTKNIQDIHM